MLHTVCTLTYVTYHMYLYYGYIVNYSRNHPVRIVVLQIDVFRIVLVDQIFTYFD